METRIVPATHAASLPGESMLVLAPHPDDEVFGCGGAILRHLEKGGRVQVVIFSDGGYGAPDGEREAYVARRRQESLAAASVLGYGEPVFRDHKDRSLHYGEALVDEIVSTVQQSAADLICAPSVMEMHPDHRALGMATVEAIRRIDLPLRLGLYEVGVPLHPNLLLDISAVAHRKNAAMRCFASQIEKQRYDLHIAGLNSFRSYTLPGQVHAAEAYLVVSADHLRSDPLAVYRPWYRAQRALGLPSCAADIPLCSVLIRSTHRTTLEEALDSVALQTWPNVEVVVVNAAGTSHPPIGARCGPFPIRLVEPGKPLDRASAANQALDAARGSYLLFLDDDDLILPHHLARLLEEFRGSAQLMASYAGVVCTNEEGKEVRHFSQPFDPVMLRLQNYLPIHAVLFRRDALQRGLRFDESLPVCEDWDFWLQMLEHWGEGAFRFVPQTGAVYRMYREGGSGVWREPERTREVMLRIYRKWLEVWSDHTLWSLLGMGRYKALYEERVQQSLQEEEVRQAEAVRRKAEEEVIQAEASRRDREHAELASRIEQQQEQLLALGREAAEHRARATALAHELSRSAARASHAESALAALHTHHAGSLAAVVALREAVLERDGRIESLHNSRSWRITRPLRSFAALVGKQAESGRSAREAAQETREPAQVPHKASAQLLPVVLPRVSPEPFASVEPGLPAPEETRLPPAGSAHQTYDYAVDLESESAGAFVYRLVGNHRRVLELGCGPGSVTRILAARGGCRVTGVEFDAASIEKARPYCEQIFQADLNAADWPAALGNPAPFEVVVAADVLEHLYDPWLALRQVRRLVEENGSIVLSLPHAGHAALAASFLGGNVAYRDWGLLDRTHIRFFGLRNIEDLVRQAGFKILEACYVRRAPEESELAGNWLALPEALRLALSAVPGADIYQIVLRAVPMDAGGEEIKLATTFDSREMVRA